MRKKISHHHCEYCGADFSSYRHDQKYCTKTCSSKAISGHQKPLGTRWNVSLSGKWIVKALA